MSTTEPEKMILDNITGKVWDENSIPTVADFNLINSNIMTCNKNSVVINDYVETVNNYHKDRAGKAENETRGLQNKVASLEGRSAILEANMNGLDVKATSIETTVASIGSRVLVLENKLISIEASNNQIKELESLSTANFAASRYKNEAGEYVTTGSSYGIRDLYVSSSVESQYTDQYDIDISLIGNVLIVKKFIVKGNWYFYVSPNNTDKPALRLPFKFHQINGLRNISSKPIPLKSTRISVGSDGSIYCHLTTIKIGGDRINQFEITPGKYLMVQF